VRAAQNIASFRPPGQSELKLMTMCLPSLAGASFLDVQKSEVGASVGIAGELFLQLNAAIRPGIHVDEFRRLFLVCTRCEKIICRTATGHHKCSTAAQQNMRGGVCLRDSQKKIKAQEGLDLEKEKAEGLCPSAGPSDLAKADERLRGLAGEGMTADFFRSSFVQCSCNIVTTYEAFKLHYCVRSSLRSTIGSSSLN
jgi:hypothetical protein